MIRLTRATVTVADLFLSSPDGEYSGAEVSRVTGLAAGTLYPILHRLQNAGWLRARWEKIDPHEEGRPRRRYYRITGKGAREYAQNIRLRQPNRKPRYAIARNFLREDFS